ncbi:hypothetical protein LTR53_014701 [Teratosphaeriaceae sp. CCFEE 6253]|nr:hypothetical protein LTR53_014701 [Teratosphaeriaceae sp. CCFEE 6253]
MAKRKAAASPHDEPPAKHPRQATDKAANTALIKRANALDMKTFRHRYVAEEDLIYRPRASSESTVRQTPHPRRLETTIPANPNEKDEELSPYSAPEPPQHHTAPPERHPASRPAPRDPSRVVEIALKSTAELTPHELDTCFHLIEQTSRHDYAASTMGWHPARKRKEMRDREMRYLLCHASSAATSPSITASTSPARSSTKAGDAAGRGVEGFLSFMLTHDSLPSTPVLYIYEIHLHPSLRRLGLGAHLLRLAESIARGVWVRKVMLTCFTSNTSALGLYSRKGYGRDVCSPGQRRTRGKVVEVDYVIMSKVIHSAVQVVQDRSCLEAG